MPFQCQLASIFPPKIHQNRIKNRSWRASIFWSMLTSIFRRPKTTPRRPKSAQDGDPSAKTAPRGPQDSPKMAPWGPKSSDLFRVFSILAAKSLQGSPETAPRVIFGSFLVDFWSIFDGFLVDFWSIFDSLFGWFLLIDFFSSSLFYFKLFLFFSSV